MATDDRGRLCAALEPYLEEVAPGRRLAPDRVADRWFDEPTRLSYWIVKDEATVGFALIRHLSEYSFELSEFSIFPKARRFGIGSAAVQRIFDLHPGRWRLGVSTAPAAAAQFWRACLHHLAAVQGLHERPPLTSQQSHSYEFATKRGPDG